MRPFPRGHVLLVILTALGAGALAVAPLPWVIVAVGGAGALVVARRRPEVVLTAGALLLPSGTIYPPLRFVLGPTYLTLFQVLVFAVAALTLVRPQARRAGIRHPLFTFGAAFVVASSVSAVGSDDLLGSLAQVVTIGALLMALSVGMADRLDTDQADVHQAVVYVGSAVALLACLEARRGTALLGPLYEDTVATYTAGGVGFRPVATIGNPLVASSSFVAVFALALVSPHIRWRYACLAVLFAAVALSLSRSSLGLLIVVTAAFLLLGSGVTTQPDRRGRLSVAGLFALLSLALGDEVLSRFGARLQGRGIGIAADVIRTSNARSAVDLWQDNWLTGVGAGGFRRFAAGGGTDLVAAVDNQFLTLLVELGVVGCLVLLLSCSSARRRRDSLRSWLPFVTAVLSGLFFDVLLHDATVLLVGLLALDTLERRSGGVRQGAAGRDDEWSVASTSAQRVRARQEPPPRAPQTLSSPR